MRTLILTLLIALLPWRAWAGDAMAAGLVLPSPAHAALQAPPPCHGHVELTHTDNPAPTEHIAHAAVTDAETPGASVNSEAHDPSCTQCGDCTMCHSVALLPDLFEPRPPALPHFSWPNSHRPFASAVTAPGHKPPIA